MIEVAILLLLKEYQDTRFTDEEPEITTAALASLCTALRSLQGTFTPVIL